MRIKNQQVIKISNLLLIMEQVVKLIKKLTKNKHYNFLETLAEDVFDVLFKDKRIGKIMLQIEKLEILKECTSVGIQITKKRSHEKL